MKWSIKTNSARPPFVGKSTTPRHTHTRFCRTNPNLGKIANIGNPACALLLFSLFTLLLSIPARAKTLDVATYGAIPNEPKDAAPAINAAIAAASPGDTILIPAGTYSIAQSILPKSNLKITGPASRPDQATLRCIATNPIPLILIDNLSDLEISSLTLDGADSPNAMQGIECSHATRLRLSNLAIQNLGANEGFAPHGIYFKESVTDSIITDNFFTRIGLQSEWGAAIRIAHSSSRNQITANTTRDTGRGGILCNDGAADLIIRKNTITGSGHHPKGEGLGIELQTNCDRAIIEDNHIDHWLSIDSSNQLAVRRNVVSDKTGVYKWCGLELVAAHDDIFTDNTVDSGQHVGISISNNPPKERIYWAHNTVKSASTFALQVQGEKEMAAQQYFYKNNFEATLRNSPQTRYPPGGAGIRVNGNASHIVFDSNRSAGNQGFGIEITGDTDKDKANISSLRFIHNQILNNRLAAVDSPPIPDALWLDNTVKGNRSNNLIRSAASPARSPSVAISPPSSPRVAQPLSFAAKFTGPHPLAHVLWDFGDSIPSTDQNPTHVFPSLGSYRIAVLIWDTTGEAAHQELTLTVPD